MIHARKDYDRIQDPSGKIAEDEPVILFRAHDALAPVMIAKYVELLRMHHAEQHMIDTNIVHELRMRQWQRINRCKLPDMPEDACRIIE